MTIAYIAGFETGDLSELNTIGTGATADASNARTGAYAFKYGTAASRFVAAGLTTTQSALRFYIKTSAAPSASAALLTENVTTTVRLRLFLLTASGFLQVNDNGASLGLATTSGSINICDGSYHRIDLVYDLAAGGVVKVWVDGVLDINTTHSSDVSATTTVSWGTGGFATAVIYADDLRIDKDTVTQIGAGQIIARQGVAGTPTYDAWTKNGGASSAADAWSETPFSATKNCSSSTSAAAQTMLVAPFSTTQSGHGTQVINAQDTINAAKTAVIIKRATSGNPKIRRRVNGTDTDTAVSATTTDKYFDDGIWTTTAANLDLLEAGCQKVADANLTTVEDVWVMVDYTPAAAVALSAKIVVSAAAKLLFAGSTSVAGSGAAKTTARATPSGTTPLATRSASQAKMFASSTGTAPLAARSASKATAKGVITGTISLLARGAAAAKARATAAGTLPLSALSAVKIMASGSFAGIVELVSGMAATMAKGRATPSGTTAMRGTVAVTTAARVVSQGVLSLSARATVAIRAFADTAARLPLVTTADFIRLARKLFYSALALPDQPLARLKRFVYILQGDPMMPGAIKDFPVIDAVIGKQTLTFDFGPFLPANVTLTGTPTVTMTVHLGTDASPSSRLIGSPVVGTAPTAQGGSGVANAAVLQQVGGCLDGVTYTLVFSCARSDGSDIAVGWAHLPSAAPQ